MPATTSAPQAPLPRQAEATLRTLARGFPVVALTGPRQSGKTTLARLVFAHLPYVNLEDPDTRELALSDPRRFLAPYRGGAVFDEVQRVPSLLSYLLGVADENARQGRMGQHVLTGSQQFGLMDGITQSLAGRVGLMTLLPLSQRETGSAPGLEACLWRGGYPALHAGARAPEPPQWQASYLATYLERDVRQLLNIGNLLVFQRFVAMCAARSGQLLNLNALAGDCGISQPTARQWLTVLQASYLVTLLPPYHRNFGKRLVKAPKLYFLDTGLLCHLLRITAPEQLLTHAARGAVFESWVVGEVLKHRHNLALPPDLYFWRDNHGLEVDLVFEHAQRLHPVECKSGMTYVADWMQPLRRWRDVAGPGSVGDPVLVYGGDATQRRADHWVLGWRDLGRPDLEAVHP